MKNKKILLFLLILGISIGFAYLSTNLNITGSSLIKGNTWDVHFENVQVTSGSVTATTPTISTDKKSVNYTVTLDMPGDYFEFTVDAVNDGTIDAMVDTVSNTGLTSDQLKYLDYTVSMYNNEPLNHGYILLRESRKTYKVKLEYKLDITEYDLPDSDQTIELTFTVNYLQTDESAYKSATFKTGLEVSRLMRQLSNSANGSSNVKSFIKATNLPNNLTNDNIISTSNSDETIYLWFEEDETAGDGTGTIYWYSNADVVYLNEDSSLMFYYSEEGNYNTFTYLTDICGLSNINTLKVKNINKMFYSCNSLSDISFLADWNVSSVRYAEYLFYQCTSISNVSALSNWDVSNVREFNDMFYNCTSLNDISALNNWDTSSARTMIYMFYKCSSIGNISALSNWNVKNVETMQSMFEYCSLITDISALSNWNTSSLKSIASIFDLCTNLTNIDALENWNVSKVENMRFAFYGCEKLNDIDSLSHWDVSNVKYMEDMFEFCERLTDISALSNWDVSKVTTMNSTFGYCTNLTDISPLSNWNVSKVADLSKIFFRCENLSDINALRNWNVSSATHMSRVFGYSKISNISALSNWNVSNVIYMYEMFYRCTNLMDASPIESWGSKLNSNLDYSNMFPSNTTTLPSWYV